MNSFDDAELDPERLLRDMKKGDWNAYALFIKEYQGFARGWAFFVTQNAAMYEDIALKAFANFWKDKANIPSGANLISCMKRYVEQACQ